MTSTLEIDYQPWTGGVDESVALPTGFLSMIPPTVDATLLGTTFDDTDALLRLCWTLRRQLWRALLAGNRGRIEFSHSAEQGFGTGPDLILQMQESEQPRLIMRTEFLYSDFLYSAGGFQTQLPWGWKEFVPRSIEWRNLHLGEADEETQFEYSFGGRDCLELDARQAGMLTPWSDIDSGLQVAIFETLIGRLVSTEAETTDYVSGENVLDILCLLADEPGTSSSILERMGSHGNPWVRRAVAFGASAPVETLDSLSGDPDAMVRRGVSTNPSASESARARAWLHGVE